MYCQVCNIHYFSCKQAYERHMKSKRHQNVVNSINNEGLNMYQCVDCLKTFRIYFNAKIKSYPLPTFAQQRAG